MTVLLATLNSDLLFVSLLAMLYIACVSQLSWARLINCTCRKGKKAPKGKISRKGEADSAGASSPALHADAQPGTRLKPKQKKKLLKEVSCSSQLLTRALQDSKTVMFLFQGFSGHQPTSQLCMLCLSVACHAF